MQSTLLEHLFIVIGSQRDKAQKLQNPINAKNPDRSWGFRGFLSDKPKISCTIYSPSYGFTNVNKYFLIIQNKILFITFPYNFG